jgi:hypothetical protein
MGPFRRVKIILTVKKRHRNRREIPRNNPINPRKIKTPVYGTGVKNPRNFFPVTLHFFAHSRGGNPSSEQNSTCINVSLPLLD